MITQTSLAGIRTLVYLALRKENDPISPRQIAEKLGLSPTYLAKVSGLLATGNLVRARRGMKGGITLQRDPDDIAALEIVEACQGKILGDFCQEGADKRFVCAYHKMVDELREAQIAVLSEWTLADLASRPTPTRAAPSGVPCQMGTGFPKRR
jgi:Rrf2 family protein